MQTYLKNRNNNEPPPSTLMQINVILGGSEVSGITKYAKVSNTNEKWIHKTLNGNNITFDDDDTNSLMFSHHDALVIKLCILDSDVKYILIDVGRTVNIIQLKVTEEMQLTDKINQNSRVLFKFNNSNESIIRKKSPHLFLQKVLLKIPYSRYMIYNIIMRRPWMEPLPSTVYQVYWSSLLSGESEKLKESKG